MPSTVQRCSPNAVRHDAKLTRAERCRLLGSAGATVWITGLPASGKSTLGAALEERLVRAGRWAYMLDGDNLRHGISAELGFSAADRLTHIARVGEVAALFADAGALAIVALVSPYEAPRRAVRQRHERDGLPFVEVFMDTPLETCVDRDPKGHYARARAGELRGYTGVDDPYERPQDPEVRVTRDMSTAAAVDRILELVATK